MPFLTTNLSPAFGLRPRPFTRIGRPLIVSPTLSRRELRVTLTDFKIATAAILVCTCLARIYMHPAATLCNSVVLPRTSFRSHALCKSSGFDPATTIVFYESSTTRSVTLLRSHVRLAALSATSSSTSVFVV